MNERHSILGRIYLPSARPAVARGALAIGAVAALLWAAPAMGEVARSLEIDLGQGRVRLDERDVSAAIREPGITAAASHISTHPQVREAMVARQRDLIAAGRYVAEGRDIGTVVSPDAPLKVFLTAGEEERARRRAAPTGEAPGAVLAAQLVETNLFDDIVAAHHLEPAGEELHSVRRRCMQFDRLPLDHLFRRGRRNLRC